MDSEAIKQIGISAIRTFVPLIVGQVMTWLAALGILDTTGEISAALISSLTAITTLGYYVVVRILEVKFSAKFGWLLGFAKTPEYKG